MGGMTTKEYFSHHSHRNYGNHRNHNNHGNHGNHVDAKHMTNGWDDRRLARLGEDCCQGRTHIESHLTQQNMRVGKEEKELYEKHKVTHRDGHT